jgi:hypothetical protein
LPIMRLVQQVLLPQPRLVHLAEVFLSGLLVRADRDLEETERETDPFKIPFDFLPEVGELLLRAYRYRKWNARHGGWLSPLNNGWDRQWISSLC